MREGIRAAQKKDLQAMLDIYAPYVKNTAVTFEYDIPSIEEFEKRFQKITNFFPWLVYEEESKVLGYAYAGTFHERKAFQDVYKRQGSDHSCCRCDDRTGCGKCIRYFQF